MPIQFDDAAADELQHQLERTSVALHEIVQRFEREVRLAAEDWRGRFRAVFDEEAQARHAEAVALAGELHFMAVAVRARQIEAQAARRAEAVALAQAEAERRQGSPPLGSPTGTVPR